MPRSSTVGGLGTGSSTGRGHEMVSRSRCVRFVEVAIARRRSDAYLPVIEDKESDEGLVLVREGEKRDDEPVLQTPTRRHVERKLLEPVVVHKHARLDPNERRRVVPRARLILEVARRDVEVARFVLGRRGGQDVQSMETRRGSEFKPPEKSEVYISASNQVSVRAGEDVHLRKYDAVGKALEVKGVRTQAMQVDPSQVCQSRHKTDQAQQPDSETKGVKVTARNSLVNGVMEGYFLLKIRMSTA